MAFRSSLHILQRLHRELAARQKELSVLLAIRTGGQASGHGWRSGSTTGSFGNSSAQGITFVDTLTSHVADYAEFSLSPDHYVGRLYNGHYTPAGNLFFAFAIKDPVVRWLSPLPPGYRDREASFAMQVAKLA